MISFFFSLKFRCCISDTFLRVYQNQLSIAETNCHKYLSSQKIQLYEINNVAYMQRFILLPGNAANEFSSAGYPGGILSIYIPPGKHPLSKKTSGQWYIGLTVVLTEPSSWVYIPGLS